MKINMRISIFALALVLPALAWSGSFRVVPIKVYFEPGITSATVKIVNEDSENLKLELDAQKWRQSQGSGADELSDSKDLIIFPKMLEIEPGKEKIVRLGYRGKPAAKEQTYRLFVKELPVIKPGEMALKFALRIGVPVFVKPLQAKTKLAIAKTEISDGKLLVWVSNHGNSHAMVTGIQAAGETADGIKTLAADASGWYVLAGATRKFIVSLSEKECAKTKVVHLEVKQDTKSFKSEVSVSSNQCHSPRKHQE